MPKRRRDDDPIISSSSSSLPFPSNGSWEDSSLSWKTTNENENFRLRPRIAEIIRTDLAITDVVLLVVRILVEPAANEEYDASNLGYSGRKRKRRARDQSILDVDSENESGIDDGEEQDVAYRLFLSDGERIIQGVLNAEMHRFIHKGVITEGSFVRLDKYEIDTAVRPKSGRSIKFLAIQNLFNVGYKEPSPIKENQEQKVPAPCRIVEGQHDINAGKSERKKQRMNQREMRPRFRPNEPWRKCSAIALSRMKASNDARQKGLEQLEKTAQVLNRGRTLKAPEVEKLLEPNSTKQLSGS